MASVPRSTATVTSVGAARSLRDRLRATAHEQPAAGMGSHSGRLRSTRGRLPAPDQCAIVCKWVTGTVRPRYRFRAERLVPRQTRIVGQSPIFFSDMNPPEQTPEARIAWQALVDELARAGWQPQPPASDAGQWWSMSFELGGQPGHRVRRESSALPVAALG